MNILSFHFGHDSTIALVCDGVVVACQLSERLLRRKHFIGINAELLESFLSAIKVSVRDIDCCALTSTQREDLYLECDGSIDLEYRRHDKDQVRSLIEDELRGHGVTAVEAFLGATPADRAQRLRRVMVPHAMNPLYRRRAVPFKFLPWMDYVSVTTPTPYASLDGIADAMTDRAVDFADNAFGFHFPATIHLLGRSMPCYLVNHHATHAAAYYLSGNRSGAILTTDGGSGRERGGWWNYAVGSQIMPIAPHFLEVGGLYSQTAIALLKLGSSAEGKMMGLAPYGQPTMFEDRLVGNGYTYDALACQGAFPASEEKRYGWERFARARVSELGYNLSDFGNPERPLDPVNADLAASVQQIIEASLMNASVALANLLKRRDVEVDGLCLAGGSMLNCPTNTRIYESKLFKDVFIPPCTEDSGCAIGAALWVHHNLFGYPLIERCATLPADPYVGMPVPAGTDKTIQQHAGIWFDHVDDAADLCAADLCQNRVVAWFEGRSEIGPRALGHRSILADPRVEGNWQRVNEVKHRATWRPFAPAVLKEHSARYFEGAPANSPYMLFNARVKSKSLPAVTHVDGTSRIQTVTRENGQFHSVIDNFYKMTGCPAVMNTSLNGPGEPIIETPLEALRFIANGYADVLYIDNFKVVPAVMRKPAPPPAS